MTRSILWMSLQDERPHREYHWLSHMPDTNVTVAGGPPPSPADGWIPRDYRSLTRRFTEAVSLSWMTNTATLPASFDWVASLELCSLVSAQSARVARRIGAKHVVTIWANDPELMFYRLPPYSLATRATRHADLYLNFIRAGYDHCLALGLPEERCFYVLPGVDTQAFTPAITRPHRPTLMYASGLVPKKGIELILRAFVDEVLPSRPETLLRFMGAGPESSLVQQAALRYPNNIELLPPGGQAEVAARLREATVFVTAPVAQRRWNEQYGLAYLEAMASGLPIVTTITGTNHEAVRPPNIRTRHDACDVGQALLYLVDNPEEASKIGAHNRSLAVAEFDLATQCRRMGEVFDTVEARANASEVTRRR